MRVNDKRKTDVLYLDTAARAASGSAFSQRLSAADGCVYPIEDICKKRKYCGNRI
jgi:hypothetical protein